MQAPPTIEPLQPTGNRPLWSVMIPVYNCAGLLPETLNSILMQDPGEAEMQIEVVDDASTDADVKSIVEKIGKGRITYYAQPQNVGSLKNFQTCITRANGYLVHLLHGDDKMKMGYYATIKTLFDKYPEIGAAFSSFEYIDNEGKRLWGHRTGYKAGILDNWLLRIAQKQDLQYCTITVKREVYEQLGSFYGVTYGEDWEMWARIAAHYKVAYSPKVLAQYRLHPSSISSQSFLQAKNIDDIKWVIDRIQTYLPEDQRALAKRKAYAHYARYAIKIANNLWHQTHSKQVTQLQIREALKMHKDVGMFYDILKIYTKMLINRV